LIITVFVFLVLLILGVRKSFKLKAENERLSKEHTEEDEKKDYEDFTEGHLY
jgi:Na+-transporting methylmalonyl-CoA/oxaloacetate decarboxylase gamma subunit